MTPIARRSIIFEAGDIVLVPFPFVEAPRIRNRPAVVVTSAPINDDPALLWVVMITTATNRGWPDDVSLEARFQECGLHLPCVIRPAKISTVEAERARRLGKLPVDLLEMLRTQIKRHLGL